MLHSGFRFGFWVWYGVVEEEEAGGGGGGGGGGLVAVGLRFVVFEGFGCSGFD